MIVKSLLNTIIVSWFLFLNTSVCQTTALDSLLQLIPGSKQDSTLSNLYLKISKGYSKKGDYENALSYADKSFLLSKQINFLEGMAQAKIQSGKLEADNGKLENAVLFLNQAMDVRKQMNDTQGVIIVLLKLGGFEKNSGKTDKAIEAYNRAAELSGLSNDSFYLARCYNNIGITYQETAQYTESISYLLKGLKIAEDNRDSLTQAMTLSSIGYTYYLLNNSAESLRYLRKSLEVSRKSNLRDAQINAMTNMVRAFDKSGQLDSLLFYTKLSFELLKTYSEPIIIARIENNVADVFSRLDQLDSALYYISDAIALSRESEYKGNSAVFLLTKAEILLKIAKKNKRPQGYKDALACLQESLTISEEINDPDNRKDCFLLMSEAYYGLNQYDEAYNYHLKYSQLNDSITNNTFTLQVAEMNSKYETEKKQIQINLLNAEKETSMVILAKRQTLNYSLASILFLIVISSIFIYRNVQQKRKAEKQVAVLEKQNAIESMRSKIASDVHDDMGAGLTKMGLFSEQLLKSTTVSVQEKQLLEKISMQSKEVIGGMREIIWASNPANDNLKSMLGFMRQYIDRFFDGTNIRPIVNFPHDTGEVALHPEVRRNLFLILKESLNNAVKYSGSDKVDIDFNNENENFNLNIKDYGKGMDGKNKDDFSNGLRNMQLRASQIQSAFKMITSPGNGVRIEVAGKLY